MYEIDSSAVFSDSTIVISSTALASASMLSFVFSDWWDVSEMRAAGGSLQVIALHILKDPSSFRKLTVSGKCVVLLFLKVEL